MKVGPLLLAGSLVANLALIAVIVLRPSQPPAPSVAIRPDSAAMGRDGKSITAAKELAALRAALDTGDAAALTAAGCTPEAVRALLVGRAFDTLQAKMRALRQSPADGRYWRRGRGEDEFALNRESTKAMREFSRVVEASFGEGIDALFSDRDSRSSFLPAAKREQLHRIERDYTEMERQIEQEQSGIQLPSDREKLKLLQQERDRDIAALFTPEERMQYELHTSNSAEIVRSRYGDALQTEADYEKIYALQKAFDDQFNRPDSNTGGPPSPEAVKARRAADQKLAEDIRDAIGPEQWAAAQQANDPDLRTLKALAQRLPVPDGAADTVLATRETYAAQSIQINANAALSPADRRTQLQALAAQAQTDLQATLGTDGAQAFAQRAQWVNMLKNGQAFSTNPKDAPSGVTTGVGTPIYPVPPPRPANAPTPPPRG